MNYRETYDAGRALLSLLADADLDARLLLEAACGTDLQTLLAHPEREVTAEEDARYQEMLARRAAREPVAYILGQQEFMGLPFFVTPDVLIPNQDTEFVTEEAMRHVHDGMRILDLCTGSGCILLSLLHYANGCTGLGTDLSEAALKVAARNAEQLGIPGASFARGDLYDAVDPGEKFDLIISNPPYIPSETIETLEPEVRSAEPHMALDGGEDGLLFYRRILAGAPQYLKPGGQLFFEIGYDEGQAVCGLMQEAGFTDVTCEKDFGGNDRVVSGTLPLL